MCDSLGAGACAVEVRAKIGAKDTQGSSGRAFRGDVDVLAGERRGGGVEDWKGRNPRLELRGYGRVEFDHF